MVKRLVRKYAKGYLWSFDENGRAVQARDEALDIESDSTGTTSSDSDGKGTYEKYSRIKEFEAVTSCFPGVRQILFAPIFDPATSNCIYASFAVSLREVPVFTTDIEVAYTRAFLNNVGVEWDRVTVSIADRTKGDFLSSISHEFRSPLHGILASTELLSDSELDTSQRGLCDTILMCGSTLLNTVSHILDYSMINDLSYHRSNKNKSIELQGGSGTATPLEGTRLGPLSPIGLYLDVDVAWICEAVVQTVCAGFAHDHSTPGSHVLHNSQAIGGVDGSGDLKPQTGAQPVMVILDVLPSDWRFATAPGAIQRVLMNLVGNSLKYTTAGFVKIELKVESDTHSKIGDDTHLVTMTVSDSGIGISQDFIRHKLYAPFTQESTLAPGTGKSLT
jgi:signal transduction histidine kinase